MRGIEQAPSLPVGRGREPGDLRDGRRQIDMAADRRRPRRRRVAARIPDQQRHVDVLIVNRPPLHVAVVRVAERLAVIAGDDDQGVLLEAGAADRLEQPLEVPIGLMQHVEVAIQIVGVGDRIAGERDQRHARRRFVGMVGLLGPGHQEERLRRLLLDELNHPVHRAAVLHPPR